MRDPLDPLVEALARLGAELAKVVRYALVNDKRTTRLAILIIIVMVGLNFLL